MPAQLLPLLVAKYLQKSHPTTFDAFISAASLSREAIGAADIPDLRDVVEQYESYVLAQQLQTVVLPEREKEESLKELVARPVNARAKETLLKTTKKTFREIGTGGFLSVRWEQVGKREFNTQSAEYVQVFHPFSHVPSPFALFLPVKEPLIFRPLVYFFDVVRYENTYPGRLVLSATDKSVKTVDVVTGEVSNQAT